MNRFRTLISVIALLVFLLPLSVHADPVFTPYTQADGYTYVVLGRYPQTAEGEIRPILWRVDEEIAC